MSACRGFLVRRHRPRGTHRHLVVLAMTGATLECLFCVLLPLLPQTAVFVLRTSRRHFFDYFHHLSRLRMLRRSRVLLGGDSPACVLLCPCRGPPAVQGVY